MLFLIIVLKCLQITIAFLHKFNVQSGRKVTSSFRITIRRIKGSLLFSLIVLQDMLLSPNKKSRVMELLKIYQ